MIHAHTISDAASSLRYLVSRTGFVLLCVTILSIIYFDDLQITLHGSPEVPTIFNVRIGGLKVLDVLSIMLWVIWIAAQLFSPAVQVSPFHRYIFTILLVYCYAGMIGFIYSFWYGYDYLDWFQDIQPFFYMTAFFLFTYDFINGQRQWSFFVFIFLATMIIKNIIILFKSLSGSGISMFYGIIRASQNSEYTYFPFMFFVLVLIIFQRTRGIIKMSAIASVAVYLLNTVLSMVRTTWVLLFAGLVVLLTHIEFPERLKIIGTVLLLLGTFIVVLNIVIPSSVEYLWEERVMSIFEWNYSGNLSNAMRLIQITNVWDRVMSHYAFIHGMGLGAWWDESARRMLPNESSEYHLRAKYRRTDILMVTQFLKLGLIGMVVFWWAAYKIFDTAVKFSSSLSKNTVEYAVVLGFSIGLFFAFLTQADFVRTFLIIGVGVGIIARLDSLSADRAGRTASEIVPGANLGNA